MTSPEVIFNSGTPAFLTPHTILKHIPKRNQTLLNLLDWYAICPAYYSGPTHQHCKLNYCINPGKIQIPCFCHNLKHNDAHLLIAAAKKRHGNIKVTPRNTEKNISFTIGDVFLRLHTGIVGQSC